MNICLKGYVDLWEEAPQCKLPPYHVWWLWSSANGDIKYLICHVTSQNHVIEVSCSFSGGISSFSDSAEPSMVVLGIVVVQTCF